MVFIGAHSALEMAPRESQPPFAIVAAYQTGAGSHRIRRLSRLGLTYIRYGRPPRCAFVAKSWVPLHMQLGLSRLIFNFIQLDRVCGISSIPLRGVLALEGLQPCKSLSIANGHVCAISRELIAILVFTRSH